MLGRTQNRSARDHRPLANHRDGLAAFPYAGAMTASDDRLILFADAELLAVDKPAGLAVHRSRLVGRDEDYLVDRLRRDIDGPLHLVNRLDRATSGLVLVARSPVVAATLGGQFMSRAVEKTYLALVRGWLDDEGIIDYPLTVGGMTGERKPASTRWRTLARTEVPVAIGRYERQRYSLLSLHPDTGRYRQLRRHLHHVHHPIVGDTTLGRGEHNRLFRQHFGSHRLLLHAWRLALAHPADGRPLRFEAPPDATWRSLFDRFGWLDALSA